MMFWILMYFNGWDEIRAAVNDKCTGSEKEIDCEPRISLQLTAPIFFSK